MNRRGQGGFRKRSRFYSEALDRLNVASCVALFSLQICQIPYIAAAIATTDS